jgi:hypothetical protein
MTSRTIRRSVPSISPDGALDGALSLARLEAELRHDLAEVANQVTRRYAPDVPVDATRLASPSGARDHKAADPRSNASTVRCYRTR